MSLWPQWNQWEIWLQLQWSWDFLSSTLLSAFDEPFCWEKKEILFWKIVKRCLIKLNEPVRIMFLALWPAKSIPELILIKRTISTGWTSDTKAPLEYFSCMIFILINYCTDLRYIWPLYKALISKLSPSYLLMFINYLRSWASPSLQLDPKKRLSLLATLINLHGRP